MPMNHARDGKRVVLVTGATGKQGGAVVRHLLAAGFGVRALTRSPEGPKARTLADGGAEVAGGDLDDPDSLVRALEGVYGVFSVQNPFEHGTEGEVRQGIALADAAVAAGLGRFVYSSVASAHRRTGIPHFDSKFEVEEHLRRTGLAHTILQPAYFMENWDAFGRGWILAGILSQPLGPDTTLQQVATDDIGAFAALAFSDPEGWAGRAVELAGDATTMAEAAGEFSRVIGREMHCERMPDEQMVEAWGEEGVAMYRWFEEVGLEADVSALREEYPGLTTLERYLRAHGWEGAGTTA